MTAPPDRIFVAWPAPSGCGLAFTKQGDVKPRPEYVLLDGPTMQAAIAAARAEGQEQGLREALACIDAQLEPLDHLKAAARKHGDTRDELVHGYAADQLRYARRAILDLIPAPPADGGEG